MLKFSVTKSCNSFDGISSTHTVIAFSIVPCTRMIRYASSRCAPHAASIPARGKHLFRHSAELNFQVRSIFQLPDLFLPQCELQSLFSCRRPRLRYKERVRDTQTRAAPASLLQSVAALRRCNVGRSVQRVAICSETLCAEMSSRSVLIGTKKTCHRSFVCSPWLSSKGEHFACFFQTEYCFLYIDVRRRLFPFLKVTL